MKTIFVLIALSISQTSFAFIDFAKETVVSSCKISNDVSMAIDHYHLASHTQKDHEQIKRSLIEVRAAFANQVTEVLNRPENSDVRLALRDLSNKMKRDVNSEPTEYGKNMKVFDAASKQLGIFVKLRKILNYKKITPPVFGNQGSETKEMKIRELNNFESYSTLFQNGKLNLPLSFEHYNDNGKGGAFQYWFELGIEFDQYGNLSVVDKGATTAMAMAGLCTREARKQNSNRYFIEYSKSKNGQCSNDNGVSNPIILDKQKIEQEGLMVAHNPEVPANQNFTPQYVASNCNLNENRRENVSLGQYEQLARRPSYNSKRASFQQASLRTERTYGID